MILDDDMDDEDDYGGCDNILPDSGYNSKAKGMLKNGQKPVPRDRENKNKYIGCAGEMEEDSI